MPEPMDSVSEVNAVPPIILFVDDDQDTLDLYGGYFETSGLWVAKSTHPVDAIEVVGDLKPNLIVADIGFDDEPLGLHFVKRLKADDILSATPVIVLSGRPVNELLELERVGADVVLSKPCPPQTLLDRARQLLEVSRELRARSQAVLDKSEQRRQRANAWMERRDEPVDPLSKVRRCPSCGSPLDWVERGTLEGQEYDYFHWCRQGCGLYCYRPASKDWIKLA